MQSSFFAWVSFSLLGLLCHHLMGAEFAASEPNTPNKEYGLTIRSTPHRSPAEELAGFHVPDGFVVDLVAAEPDIQKPLNLAFDSQGRLWITQTNQYPFPAKEGERASDSIIILEDRDRNGHFEGKTLFASDLNIPIAVLPVSEGAICFSIPNIWMLRDLDKDGRCDEREILYGPFDTTRDTHGMVNSFRDGGDGWIYACHGFNNQSKVAGKDGHQVTMTSGNTFRFRIDGSRIELFTQGQVNPFGMTRDSWGNWFTADCHSKPITQLVRGGCYPSFGRPDDGLGFVPATMDHSHGSTAIAGLAHTKDSFFPESMAGQLLSGNVMTCRINRNQLEYTGATAKAMELPDLLTSDDSWFRPVDLVFGPDGHLYVADFYNKIIGHYEVPLDHPDRDRNSGRIWRIRWVGNGPRISSAANLFSSSDPGTKVSVSWLKEAEQDDLSKTDDAMTWLHAMQKAEEFDQDILLPWLFANVKKVMETSDGVLKQAFIIAFRNSLTKGLQEQSVIAEAQLDAAIESHPGLESPLGQILTKVLPACRQPRANRAAIELLEQRVDSSISSDVQTTIREQMIDRLAEVIEEENMDRYLRLLTRDRTEFDAHYANRLLSIGTRQKQSRGEISRKLTEVAFQFVNRTAGGCIAADTGDWAMSTWFPSSSKQDDLRPWPMEERRMKAGDGSREAGDTVASLFSSFPLGEKYVGKWTSSPFPAPGRISFRIAGHNGLPAKEDHRKNFVRLIAIESGSGATKELFRAYPPRNDVAERVEWELDPFLGQKVFLEVTDGDASGSYAWIAVGDFSPRSLASNEQREAVHLCRSFVQVYGLPLPSEAPAFFRMVDSRICDDATRFQLIRSRLAKDFPIDTELLAMAMETGQWDLLAKLPSMPSILDDWNPWFATWRAYYPQLFKRWSAALQSRIVNRMSRFREAASRLAEWMEAGVLPPEVLATLPPSWWVALQDQERLLLERWRATLERRMDRSKLLETTLEEIASAPVDLGIGKRVYTEKCSICHKLGSEGAVVGPQLEGVGNRGWERLCEDILWPDRNVDEAFRVTLFAMENGETVTGLVQQRTAAGITIVDSIGNKRVLLANEIEMEKKSDLSLMPGNFHEVLQKDELASLLHFLQKYGSAGR
jgi:putative heme-binding domain-containing protein